MELSKQLTVTKACFVYSLIRLELMVLNIIETANATDFITSQGIHRLFAPKIFKRECYADLDSNSSQ